MQDTAISGENNNDEHPMVGVLVEASFECCVINGIPCPFATGIFPAAFGPKSVMTVKCSKRPGKQTTRTEAVECNAWMEVVNPPKPSESVFATFIKGRIIN